MSTKPEPDKGCEELRAVLPLYKVPEVPETFQVDVLAAWEEESARSSSVRVGFWMFYQRWFVPFAWVAVTVVLLCGGRWMFFWGGQTEKVASRTLHRHVRKRPLVSRASSDVSMCQDVKERKHCLQEARQLRFFIQEVRLDSVGEDGASLGRRPGTIESFQQKMLSIHSFVDETR